MSDVAVAVESSAPPTDNRNFEPDTYTPAESAAFMQTGKIPDVKPPAESSPAEKKEVVAPESAAGPQQGEKELGAAGQARIRELAAKVKELEARELARSTPAVKTESASVKPAKAAPMPVFGEKGHEEETFGEFEGRKLTHVTQQAVQTALAEDRAARETERKEADTVAANKVIEDAWQEAVDATAAELKMSREEFAAAVFIKDLPISKAMDEFIVDAGPRGPKILHYLATHLDEGKAIAAMPKSSMAHRALIKIEDSLNASAPPEKAVAPVVPITKAAKPGTDLKAVNAAPVDELKAAVESGDIAAFNRIQDAKLLARRRG